MRTGRFGSLGAPVALAVIGAGFIAIGVGWNGAASKISVAAQLPYLISGAALGLGLIIAGSALMIVQSAREDRARIRSLLESLGSGQTTVVRERAEMRSPEDLAGADGLVVAGSGSAHAPGCRLVDGQEQPRLLTPREAADEGLRPCRVCRPQLAERV